MDGIENSSIVLPSPVVLLTNSSAMENGSSLLDVRIIPPQKV